MLTAAPSRRGETLDREKVAGWLREAPKGYSFAAQIVIQLCEEIQLMDRQQPTNGGSQSAGCRHSETKFRFACGGSKAK